MTRMQALVIAVGLAVVGAAAAHGDIGFLLQAPSAGQSEEIRGVSETEARFGLVPDEPVRLAVPDRDQLIGS